MQKLDSSAGLIRQWAARFWDGDLVWSFRTSPVTICAAILAIVLFAACFGAGWFAPHNPTDVASIELANAGLPPAWSAQGDSRFWLGTDIQGRDILSSIMYGGRISLTVGLLSVLFAATLGITLGLISGYFGGVIDVVIMRIAEVQLSFPAILIALLIDGVVRGLLPASEHEAIAVPVLVVSIGLSFWVQYARTVRGSTLIEKHRDYISAARIIGLHPALILVRHILPNVIGPVLVIATLNLALAVITEATLSFLGVGVPPTQPSLGTLIRIGNEYLFSGEWWITVWPGLALVLMVLSVNLLSDWLRDALNPKLR
jgi:peptide/nickel transport system permease protein